jgi:hypothetical protein
MLIDFRIDQSLRIDPSLRFRQLGDVKVLDFRRCKRFAENRHAFFPFRFADDRQSLDVFPMLEVELHVFPQRAGSPAVEVVHLKQNAELAVFLNLLIDDGSELFVSFLGQFARHFDVRNFSTGDKFEFV